MKSKIFLFLLLCTNSCAIKEEVTYTKTFIINNSGYEIAIEPYQNGGQILGRTKYIPRNGKIEILDESNRGKGIGYFYATELMFTDSTIVRFDGKHEIVHYTKIPANLNPKHIKFESPRSLYNGNNYQRVITSEKRYSIYNEYTFEFTLQDYLDAQ